MTEQEQEKIETNKNEENQDTTNNQVQATETQQNLNTNMTTTEEEKNQTINSQKNGKNKKFNKTIKTDYDHDANFETTQVNENYQRHANRTNIKSQAEEYHEAFKKYGLKSLHVLDKNITNPRYPGFSEFFSSNSLQNSAYCWTVGKDVRIKDKSYKKYNDNIYNLPDFKSTRFTIPGYGLRKDFRPVYGKGDPSPDAYHLKSLFEFNVTKRKGPTMLGKSLSTRKDGRYMPGPGTYNIAGDRKFGNIPISVKSRQGFFYDDDLKKKKFTVSMQRYKPIHTLVEPSRFDAITFGIGDRPKLHVENRFPGPGSYNVPGNFDRGYKGKLALN